MPRHSYKYLPLAKLIREVKKYSHLYDRAHPDYRSILKKAATWSEIAKKFNQDPQTIKMKWKNCRDGYLKHKRLLKSGTTQSVMKYKAWPWTKHMKFLDNVLLVRSAKLNDSPSSDIDADNSETQSDQESASENPSSPGSLSLKSEKQSPADCAEDIILPSSSTQINPPSKEIRKDGMFDDCVDSYLEQKQNLEEKYDEVDDLFRSYAKTFKRFTLHSQVKLKVQLAQLFAETELAELDEQHLTQSPSSLLVTNSARTDLTEPSPVNGVTPVCINSTGFREI